MRSRWRTVLGVAVSAIFLSVALRDLQLGEFFENLQHAQYLWLLPGVGVYFLGVVARTWRWQYMLRPLGHVPMYPLFRIVSIGYMGNNIYPVRAGEVLRSYVLWREYDLRISSSLATVVIERLFDGLVMLAFVFVALPFVSFEAAALGSYRSFIISLTILFAGALVVFLFIAARPALARAIYEPLVQLLVPKRYSTRVLETAGRFLVGFESLAGARDVFMIFVTSVLVWLFETGKYWFVMHAFPFEVSFLTLMLMNGVVNLATTIPAAPGYAGTFDLPGIAVLMAAGVQKSIATAYTLVLHVALWLPITALGAYYLWASHVSVKRARAEMEAQT